MCLPNLGLGCRCTNGTSEQDRQWNFLQLTMKYWFLPDIHTLSEEIAGPSGKDSFTGLKSPCAWEEKLPVTASRFYFSYETKLILYYVHPSLQNTDETLTDLSWFPAPTKGEASLLKGKYLKNWLLSDCFNQMQVVGSPLQACLLTWYGHGFCNHKHSSALKSLLTLTRGQSMCHSHLNYHATLHKDKQNYSL